MARNAGGTYSLPAGNPVVTGTVIASSWANTTLSDIAAEMTDSLDRSGKGGMLAPLLLADGAVGTPGLAFTSEPSTGIYRAAANDLRVGVAGVDAIRLTTAAAAPRIIFTSPQAGAGAQTDFVFNTTNARTAGNIFDVQNNGASRLTISNTGVVTAALGFVVTAGGLTVTAGGLTVTAGGLTVSAGGITSTGQTLTVSDLAAASALADVTLRTLNTRTAGHLLDVQNNVTSAFNVAFDGTFQHISSTAAAGTGTDFFFNTTARTAGLIFDVQRSGGSIFNLAFDGGAMFSPRRAAGATGADFLIAPITQRTAGNLFEIDNVVTTAFAIDFAGRVNNRITAGSGGAANYRAIYPITADVAAAVPATPTNFGVQFTLSANRTYRFRCCFWTTLSVLTIGPKYQLVITTATGNGAFSVQGLSNNTGGYTQGAQAFTALPSTLGGTTFTASNGNGMYTVDVTLIVSGTGGTAQFTLAPSAAGTATIKAGSWIEISDDAA